MKLLYIDAFAGISGDMTVGALLGLGVALDEIAAQLRALPLGGYRLDAQRRSISGIDAIKFDVHVIEHAHHTHRPFRAIRQMLDASTLTEAVKTRALAIFSKLAQAEGHVHGVSPEEVEFHEVGAVDSIVDVVATAIGVTALDIGPVYVSPLPLGSGLVQAQHGPLPIPGPATLELLRGFVTRPADGSSELVTPTGAAIVAALAQPTPPPELRVERIGYGAGERTLPDRPNLLRLILARPADTPRREQMVLLETNIDDANPEIYEYVFERLFAAGARDVFLTPVQMKKNRPAVVLSVLAAPPDCDRLASIILSETTAIGVRHHVVDRIVLPREVRDVVTPYGSVRVKIARSPDGGDNVAPEYDDCKRVAQSRNVPLKLVYDAAIAAARASRGDK